MEGEKKNNGTLVGILIGVVLSLLVVFCLYATGTIGLKTSTTTTDNEQSSVDNTNREIDSALLNNLYNTLGINQENNNQWWGDCINYFLSNNNYKENAKKIFGLYAYHNKMSTNHYSDGSCNEECKKAYSCAECSSIKKVNAEKIIKLYSLDNLKFEELPGFSDEYKYNNGIPAGVCHYKMEHNNLSSQYTDNNTITITDKQVATDYVFGDENKVNSTKNQTVTYEFKKDNEGNYFLNKVTVI